MASFALLPLAQAVCDQECQSLSGLLSDCSLPAISPVWAHGNTYPQRRNLTGLPSEWNHEIGPNTYLIANYSQADCFCNDAPAEIKPCFECYQLEWEGGDMSDLAPLESMHLDCEEFGYFDNSTLSHPSTTLSSMPVATQMPDYSGSGACDDVCGVLGGQIAECDLTPLDTDEDEWPSQEAIPLGWGGSQPVKLLLNRTAAECLCTLPVMRRMIACKECLRVDEEFEAELKLRPLVLEYGFECYEMGYWTDREWVVPQLPEDTDGGSPKSTEDAEGTGVKSGGLVLVPVLTMGLLLLSQELQA